MAHLNSNLQELTKSQIASREWAMVRANASEYFQAKGVPTRQDEAWKYTSLRGVPWEKLEWKVPTQNTQTLKSLAENKVQELFVDGSLPVVFVNGILIEELSKISEIEAHASIEFGLGRLAGKTLKTLKKARRKVQKVEQDSLEALNAMDLQSLLTVAVRPNAAVKAPLQLIYLNFASEQAGQPRVQIALGEHSKIDVIETFWQAPGTESLQNSVCEIHGQSHSGVNYLRVVEGEDKTYHVGRTRVYLEASARFEGLSLLLGTHLGRHNLEVFMMGEDAYAQVNGASLVAQNQHADHHTVIDHVVGHCVSKQLYKNLLADQSRAIFDGKVVIRQDSQKAYSEQLNKNLLLSSQAEADSKPQLEIFADDVKATHGSTVGQLSEDELFYFLSRGISRANAEEMLSLGFVAEMASLNSNEQFAAWTLARLQNAYRRMRT